jgi:hypothetical protein
MAPEQLDDRVVDHRSDLFSLGVLMYRMITGVLPFSGADMFELLQSLASATPAPPSKLNPAASRAVDELVCLLLAKRPDERPQSALEVAEKIREIERPFPASRKTVARVTGAVAVIAVVGWAFVAWRSPIASKSEKGSKPAASASATSGIGSDTERETALSLRPYFKTLTVRLKDGRRPDVIIGNPLPDEPFELVGLKSPSGLPFELAGETFDALSRLKSLEVYADWDAKIWISDQDSPRFFSALKQNKIVELAGNFSLTPAVMHWLRGCPSIAAFACDASSAGDDLLIQFGELRGLRRLGLGNLGNKADVGVRGRAAIASLPLSYLYIGGRVNGMDAVFCKALSRNPELRRLSLYDCDIDDRGLAELARCPKLEELFLANCPSITDSGLSELKQSATLRSLHLTRLKTSKEAAQKLASAMPKCVVEYDFIELRP